MIGAARHTNHRYDASSVCVRNLRLHSVDAEAFCGAEAFNAEISRLAAWVKASPPVIPGGEVLLPGEIERRSRVRLEREGIALDVVTRRQITDSVRPFAVELPTGFAP